ncbi:glycosyltransferase [Trichlorobacter lovleyi]|uniref:Glycosyl transferase group 1 n=1 Tax=Trichlorobacter lovleyi (strain ATCC BAA-1151 / DSM 17278 / SZ) TaxID=398767 RepID=B3E8U4_TRIL1|nr:glycosyltransferase [Trichlorobacter lovleyi]ACD95212.1 glycosyl transferase group 1 [Trichlorobacter lovleyi SZ]
MISLLTHKTTITTINKATKYKLRSVAVVTSIHPDFDARIWKHVNSLAERGIRVEFICPWERATGVRGANLSVNVFPRVANRLVRGVLVPWRVLHTLFPRLSQVDLVHFHDLDLLPWMALLALFKPVVYDVHENYAEEMLVREWIPKPLRIPLKRLVQGMHWFFPLFVRNIVIVVPQQETEFTGRGFNVISLPNYASIKLLEGYRDDYLTRTDRIIFTGGHYQENGSSLILEVARRLKKRQITVEIWVTDRFASRDFEKMFRNTIKEELLAIQVVPSVSSSSLMELLNQATIGLAPNLRVRKQELAIPTKLFEYMAAGLPIVSSDLPYQQQLINKHKNGILAKPEDPDSFVAAIEKLVQEKELAQKLGCRGQLAFRECYTWESQIPRLISLYERMLETEQ